MTVRKGIPEIDTTRCTGCGRCVAACELHLLSLELQGRKKCSTLRDTDRCTGCAACEAVCPFNVIVLCEEATLACD